MKNLIINMFNLEPHNIEQLDIISCGNENFATITLRMKPTVCPHCGNYSSLIHDYYNRTLNHSVLADHHLTVIYKRRRYYCRRCKHAFPEKNPFSLPGRRISKATVLRIMKLLQKQTLTFTDVSDIVGVSTSTVIRVFDEYAGVRSFPFPKALCIDEVYVSKYLQQEYACVLMDFNHENIFDLLPSRKKENLASYFSLIPKGTRLSVKYVSIDMWNIYRDIASEYFPRAIICVDSFHVIQMINNAFDKVRIRIMNTYERNTEEYRLLKKYHWLLKKSADKIEYDKILDLHHYYSIVGARHISQEALISRLLLISPELELAYELKTDYAAINATFNFQNAEYRIDKFLEDMKIYGIPEFYSTRRTMKRWKTEIVNSFQKYNG